MAATRPYFLVFKGETYIIDAPSSALAVQHVVGADIAELRPARAAEVSAWVREGKPIPVAGEKVAAAVTTADPGVAKEPPVDVADVAAWLADQISDSPAAATGPVTSAWQRIVTSKRMTLEDFDIIRVAAPAFAEACAHATTGPAATDVEQIRASLEENPMAINDLVEAVEKVMKLDEAIITDRDGPR